MKMWLLHVLSFLQVARSAKILMYNPLFAQSHVNFMSTIAEVLTEEGHELTVLTPVNIPTIRFDESKFHRVIKVPMPRSISETAIRSLECPVIWTANLQTPAAMRQFSSAVEEGFFAACLHLLNQTSVFEELRATHFDLGISEFFDGCGVGIFHRIGLENTIVTSSALIFESLADAVGVPIMSDSVPSVHTSFQPAELADSWLSRTMNIFITEVSRGFFNGLINGAQRAFDMFYDGDFPRLHDLAANSSLVLTNTDPHLDFPRPTLRKVVDIGGIHIERARKNLTQVTPRFRRHYEWEAIVDERPQTVLISFGTVAKSSLMPRQMKNTIVDLARHFPETTFIWKYEEPEDEIGQGVPNLVKVAWTPQNELLQSGKITAFVTHSGMGSVLEAATSGTPVLAVGLFADQMRNAATMVHHGMAIALEKLRLGEPGYLEAALRRVIEDQRFATNAKRIAAELASRPFSPRELLVRHVSFVAEHGPLHHTRPVSTQLAFIHKHHLDTYLGITSLIIFLLSTVICYVQRRLTRAKHVKGE